MGRRRARQRFQDRGAIMLGLRLFAALCVLLISGEAVAQAYPTRPVKLIVPYPAGGSSDLIGRVVARGMTEDLGQQVVVENIGGAGGRIGVEATSKGAPNG